MEDIILLQNMKINGYPQHNLQNHTKISMKKKQRAALRTRDAAKLSVIAKKKVTQMYRDKFYKNYKDMSLQQRVQADAKIQQKYGAAIAKKVIRILPQLKAAEKERVKAARAAYGDKDE